MYFEIITIAFEFSHSTSVIELLNLYIHTEPNFELKFNTALMFCILQLQAFCWCCVFSCNVWLCLDSDCCPVRITCDALMKGAIQRYSFCNCPSKSQYETSFVEPHGVPQVSHSRWITISSSTPVQIHPHPPCLWSDTIWQQHTRS